MITDYELQIKCVGLENNGTFPLEYTGRGKDISPEFILTIFHLLQKLLLLHWKM